MGNVFIGDTAIGLRTSLDLSTNNDIGVVGEYLIVQANTFIGGYNPIGATGIRHCLIEGNTIRDVINVNGVALTLGPYAAGPGYDSLDNTMSNNIIHNCRMGIILNGNAVLGAKRTIVTNNQITRGAGVAMAYGIREMPGGAASDNLIMGNRIVVDGAGRVGMRFESAATSALWNVVTALNGATAIVPGLARIEA